MKNQLKIRKIIFKAILLTTLLVSFSAKANSDLCQNLNITSVTSSLKHIEDLVNTVNLKYFNMPIKFIVEPTLNGDEYFLQARPPIKTVLTPKKSRKIFKIQINPKLFEDSPSDNALKAILIHELTHVTDQLNKSTAGIIGSAINYISHKEYHRNYERSTDVKALDRAKKAGRLPVVKQGLIEYRCWQYSHFNAKQIQTKKYYYLSPEEIEKIN